MKLGRLVEHDPISRNFPAPFRLVDKVSILHRDSAPILDQGDVGGCVGWTCADILNTAMFVKARQRVTRLRMTDASGLKFYALATNLDSFPGSYPPNDTGSSGLAGAKAMHQLGFIDSYTHTFGHDAFLAALQRQPVMIGTVWTEGMFDPDASGLIRPTGAEAGGHEYMARGINWSTGRIRCRNHWTRDWGLRGEFEISITDMLSLLDRDGDVVVPTPVV